MDRLREVIRKLIMQIEEEKKLRRETISGKVEREKLKTPTDEEVEKRIGELSNG